MTGKVLEFLAYADDVRVFIKKMIDKNIFDYPRALQIISEFSETEKRASTPKLTSELDKKLQLQNYNSYNSYNERSNYLGNTYNTYQKPNLTIAPVTSINPDIPNKPINIKIINNNYNQYIINSEQANLEKKQKSINTFRKSYIPEEKKTKDSSFTNNASKYNSKNVHQIPTNSTLQRNNSKSGLISTKNNNMINSKVYSTKYTSLVDNTTRPASAALKPRHTREASTGSSSSYNIQRIPSANNLLRNNSVRDRYMSNPLSGNNTTRPLTRVGKTSGISYNMKPNIIAYTDDYVERRGYSLTSRNNQKRSYDNKGYLSKKFLI